MARAFWRDRVEAARLQRVATSRSRVRQAVSHRDGALCTVDGRELLNFCSNDYLGLSRHYAVVGALQDAAAAEGTGGAGSHLGCGHHQIHDRLEKEIADWLGTPRALLFGNGYLANLAVVPSLLGDDDVCVQDRLNHASLIDAARLAGCHVRHYSHGDPEGAIRQLRSKALGGYGAVVAGEHALIEHLAQTARPYLYTTALPAAQAAASLAAVKLARNEQWRRDKLTELVAQFRDRAHRVGLELLPSDTPIQPVMVGDDARAVSMAAALQRSGYWVAAIRPPTVREGRARLRVTLSALHATADVDGLVEALLRARDRAEAEARIAAHSRCVTP